MPCLQDREIDATVKRPREMKRGREMEKNNVLSHSLETFGLRESNSNLSCVSSENTSLKTSSGIRSARGRVALAYHQGDQSNKNNHATIRNACPAIFIFHG